MQKEEIYKHSKLTYKIIACAMAVHRRFGPGFREIIYERALEVELQKRGLRCIRQKSQDLYYEEAWVGAHRLDMVVEDKVLVENKAVTTLEPIDFVKTVNYLKVFDYEVGLLFNFGSESLQFRRLANKEAKTR